MRFYKFVILIILSLSVTHCMPLHEGDLLSPNVAQSDQESVAKVEVGDIDNPTFLLVSKTIFQKKCNSCHNAEAVSDRENNIFTNFEDYSSVLQNSVTPESSSESLLFVYTYFGYMPHDREPLEPLEVAMIKNWIDQGAKYSLNGDENPIVEEPPLVDHEVIDGEKLYTTNCSTCHGPLSSSTKRGRSAAQIRAATTDGRMGIVFNLSDKEALALAKALQ